MAAPAAVAEKPFVVELDSFSGPLDLLLHLIREQELDIADIPIAQVADQFLAVIEDLGLNDAAEYLEMAARLLRIKILMLLPQPVDEDWEDPRADLVRRLLEYEQIREVADWFVDRVANQAGRYSRGWAPELPEPPVPEITLDLQSIVEAVEYVIEAMPQPIIHRVIARPLDVEGARQRIQDLLLHSTRLDFVEIVRGYRHVAEIVSALIALLELARLGKVHLLQRKPFGSFTVSSEPSDEAP